MRKDVIYKDSMTQTKGMDMTLLLAHAEDHLMTAILAKDLITEMIEFYKINNKGDNQNGK